MNSQRFKKLVREAVHELLATEYNKRVCAWCKKDMGVSGSENPEDMGTTHGICPECLEKMRQDITRLNPKDAPSPTPPQPPPVA